ncbi:molybdopterin synthase, large subunit [Campylobacter hyointestinalis subsp. lawsonii CCUG 27631]|uniref:molybdopterin synthase catalytic subunit n=1 Tax=Campylobacter hyointestinalis TaxID=198 RepID=UPI0007C992A6|nr:molybdenum cofactor biosynthesis protein MoaE [Campylobacter hyointestinalis]ANE33632.1 molybdopterin synthase, large subunit [Campylobacter hyointestinalis subsp. lawsonii CCUG 27631]
MELYNGELNVTEITNRWFMQNKDKNYGAIITFVGVVRDEDGIDGLSFDIYEPLLKKWFDAWQEKAKEKNATIFMAHSKGDVPNHASSFIAGVLSPKRKVALSLINDFVEDFKANAPIWKYDLKNAQRIYAKDRSQAINGAGILS